MGDLLIRYSNSNLVLAEGDSLGFGRTTVTGSSSKGWGYEGRFLELDDAVHVHRIWGEIAWRGDTWVVRCLGARDPIVIVAPGRVRVELPPYPEGGVPAEYAMTDGAATVVLMAGSRTYSVECATVGGPAAPLAPGPRFGQETATLGEQVASLISQQEFRVLWVMAREYRSGTASDPAPLSYSRIVRALQLNSDKQATAAVERLKERFAAASLIPDEVTSDRQRDWMCRFAIQHRVFSHLIERYGEPEAD